MPNRGQQRNSNESKASETKISIIQISRQLRRKIGEKPSAESFTDLLRNRFLGSDCLTQIWRPAKPPHRSQSGTFWSLFLSSISSDFKGLPTRSTKAWYWSFGRRIVLLSKKFSSKTFLRADRTICVLVVPCILAKASNHAASSSEIRIFNTDILRPPEKLTFLQGTERKLLEGKTLLNSSSLIILPASQLHSRQNLVSKNLQSTARQKISFFF